MNQHQNIQRYVVEQQFVNKHPDFGPHLQQARAVAEELVKRYPQHVQRMSQEQFIDEVARQTDVILTNEFQRWYPGSTKTWRDAVREANGGRAQAPAQAPAPAPTQAAAPPPAPAPRPAPAQQPPRPRPPAAAVPAGPGNYQTPSWQGGVAASLR